MASREVAYGGAAAGGGGVSNHTKKLKMCCNDQPGLDSIFASAPSNCFLDSGAMVSFGALGSVNNISNNTFYQSFDGQENGDEYLDDYFNQHEKKKRLSVDQIHFLERSFEAENKLEPERKIQLANELGLPPRQIAIWFQNRRARCKTKQLETDYETLHANYKSLKIDYDCLLMENAELKAEVFHIKHDGLAGDSEKIDLQIAMSNKIVADMICNNEQSKVLALSSKNEEQSSTKSDITNAESPRLVEEIHPLLLESGESSHIFEPDQSDLSHNEEDCLNEELLQGAFIFCKTDDAYSHPHANSCGYGFALEDHAFGFRSY